MVEALWCPCDNDGQPDLHFYGCPFFPPRDPLPATAKRTTENHVRNALVESAGAHLDKAMLTKCLSCGHLGTDHVDRMPPGCDGFKMENTDADGSE